MKLHMVTRLVLLTFAFLVSTASIDAKIVTAGELTLTGAFTVNHLYSPYPGPQIPYGTFSALTVESSTGIFNPYISTGDVLTMNSPVLYISRGSTPVEIPGYGTFYGTLPQPMLWNIGDFTLQTLWTNAAGRFLSPSGIGVLSSPSFDPPDDLLGVQTGWRFSPPPYEYPSQVDVTGDIRLKISVLYITDHVPDTGITIALLGSSIFGMIAFRYVSRRTFRAHGGRALMN